MRYATKRIKAYMLRFELRRRNNPNNYEKRDNFFFLIFDFRRNVFFNFLIFFFYIDNYKLNLLLIIDYAKTKVLLNSFWFCWYAFSDLFFYRVIFHFFYRSFSFLRRDKDGKENRCLRFLFFTAFVLSDYYFFLFKKFNSFRVESKAWR